MTWSWYYSKTGWICMGMCCEKKTMIGSRICLQCFDSVGWAARKGIRPVKNWVVGCWRGYASGVRCRFAYVQLIMPLPLTVSCSSKSRLVLPEWFCFSGASLPRFSWKKAIKLGQVMYRIWSGGCQTKRQTKEDLERGCAERLWSM